MKTESVTESDSESEEECTLPDRHPGDCMQPQDCSAAMG